MTFGSLFQLIGAAGAVLFFLLHLPVVAAVFMAFHFAGDVIEKLFQLPSTSAIAKEAAQYVKLRAFLLFVGIALMLVGHFTHIALHVVTSNGLFILGFFLAIIGAFTYPEIYT